MLGIVAAIVAGVKGHYAFAGIIGGWSIIAVILALTGVPYAVAPGWLFLVIAIGMSKKTDDAAKDDGPDHDIGLSAAPDKKFICKACGSYSSGWYQTCPVCGAVGSMEKASRVENLQQLVRPGGKPKIESTLTLYGITGAFAGAAIPLKGTLPVGTEKGNRILYPVGTPGVSRRHCIITVKETGVFVRDCGSSYGTWINDTLRLQENQEFEVHQGDRINLGSNHESFILDIGKDT